jgi:1,4-alpha-glucan branching enzyme
VSLAGSFNGWNALSHPFIWKDGAWTNTLQLEPGDYEYKIVVDGVWIPDPNNKMINLEDNFNSKLTVE